MNNKFDSRFDINEKELNKSFDINDAKFDVLTKSLCSIESKLSEICSEAKRETNESRECVCTCLLYTSPLLRAPAQLLLALHHCIGLISLGHKKKLS